MISNKVTYLHLFKKSAMLMITKYLFYSIAIISGAAAFFWLQGEGLPMGGIELLTYLITYVYVTIGIVSIALIPLSVALLLLAGMQIGYHFRFWGFKKHHLRKYELIENAAPICGILGTMTGLVEALRGLDVSQGLQTAITNMSLGVGQALWSSVLGLILALVAYIFKHIYTSYSHNKEV